MNNRILLLLSNLNSQFGNTLLTTQHMEEPESLPSWPAQPAGQPVWKAWKALAQGWMERKAGKLESQKAWKARKRTTTI